MSRESVSRQLGFLARRAGDSEPAMASEELRLVPPLRMENGSSSRMAFRDDGLPFSLAGDGADNSAARKPRPSGFYVMEGDKFFPDDRMEAVLRRSLYGSLSRAEHDQNRRWNVESNGASASCGDGSDGDEDDEDEDDDLDEGDGEDDGLVSVAEGNVRNTNTVNSRSGSILENTYSEKSNMQDHYSSFGEKGWIFLISWRPSGC
ncbi:hypothetical protein AXF42_Ash008615 [Apostasia shenzhenica]|uniref:Uncharacterized protein n=1 Tax=Apostasia shenzhenica TaxID=1088818 RepID=A0A2I0B1X8_9ASPA|nr:hypothetical protein AXF42_Ash008615 [Apostasia shenzhenica]